MTPQPPTDNDIIEGLGAPLLASPLRVADTPPIEPCRSLTAVAITRSLGDAGVWSTHVSAVSVPCRRMGTLDVEGRRVVWSVVWSVVGSGPALLAPECNYRWTPSMVDTMSRSFSVVMVSPSDFGASDRPGAPYVADRWVADVRAVLDHLDVEHCAVFGYSFTGAFGPWLAQRLPARIMGVASGGFPLLGNYTVTADDVRGQLAALAADPASYAAVDRDRFDPRAGSAFYDALAALPDDALVDACPCPLYCFWGEHDTDAVAAVMPSEELSAGLTARRVPHQVLAGVDHEELNASLELAWPGVESWLRDHLGELDAR